MSEEVRLNIYMPRDAFEALKKLQKLTGHRSLSATVRAALKFYATTEGKRFRDRDLVLVDPVTLQVDLIVTR